MTAPFSNTRLRVPNGFHYLLEDLARETLRDQPTDIPAFAQQYFQNLLKLRNETGKDPLARTNRERSTHEHQEKSRKMAIIQPQMQTPQPPVTEANDLKKQQDDDLPDLDDPDMEVAAIKIQSVFRGHNARKNVQKAQSVEKCPTPVEAEEEMPDLDDPELAVAATKIQSTFRGHKARKQINKQPVEKSTSVEKSPVEKSPSVEAEEEMPDLNDPELAVAATKIQSTFRGHKARKQITEKQIKPQHSTKETSSPEHAEHVDHDEDQAALKIQSHFRGYRCRKNLNRANSVF